MTSRIALRKTVNKSALFALLALAVGCAHTGKPGGETIVTGKAIDARTGQALIGKPLKVLDIRTRPTPFGIPRPLVVATGTTGAAGTFRMVVPGNYKNEWLDIWFEGVSVPYEGSTAPSATWRIVDVAVANRPQP